MKKISMLLVSILIILSFTGCNNKKTSEDFKKVDYDLKDLEYVKYVKTNLNVQLQLLHILEI